MTISPERIERAKWAVGALNKLASDMLKIDYDMALPAGSIDPSEAAELLSCVLDRVERLEERCAAYKGQIKTGSEEIARLQAALTADAPAIEGARAEAIFSALEPFENLASLLTPGNGWAASDILEIHTEDGRLLFRISAKEVWRARDAIAAIRSRTPVAAGTDGGWRTAHEAPPIKAGQEKAFIVAVRRAKSGKVSTFPAYYLNAYPLSYEDGCSKCCDNEEFCEQSVDGCPTTGWFSIAGNDDDARQYESLHFDPGDEFLGWSEIQPWPASPSIRSEETK